MRATSAGGAIQSISDSYLVLRDMPPTAKQKACLLRHAFWYTSNGAPEIPLLLVIPNRIVLGKLTSGATIREPIQDTVWADTFWKQPLALCRHPIQPVTFHLLSACKS